MPKITHLEDGTKELKLVLVLREMPEYDDTFATFSATFEGWREDVEALAHAPGEAASILVNAIAEGIDEGKEDFLALFDKE